MNRYLLIVFAVLTLSGCKKTQQTACGTQVCTDLFASVGVHYFDQNNYPVVVKDFKVMDLRTRQVISHVTPANSVPSNYMEVVDDNDKEDLSTEGDNVQVSATDPTTNQNKAVVLKIAGGCNCHVTKLSGPDTIRFN